MVITLQSFSLDRELDHKSKKKECKQQTPVKWIRSQNERAKTTNSCNYTISPWPKENLPQKHKCEISRNAHQTSQPFLKLLAFLEG